MKVPKRQNAAKFKDVASKAVELPTSQIAWPIPLAALIATSWVWVIAIFISVLLSSLIWITTADVATDYANSVYTAFVVILLSHSIPIVAGGLTFSIPPLIITVFMVWLIKKATQWAVKSTLITNLAGVLLLVASIMLNYAILALIVSAIASPVASINASRVIIHASLWALVGSVWGILRSPGEIGPSEKRQYSNVGDRTNFTVKPQSPHTLLIDLWQSSPNALKFGFAFASRSMLLQLIIAFLFASVIFVFSLNDMLDVISLVATNTVSTIVLIASFVVYIPNIIIWYFSLLVGPGFVVGGGSAVTLVTQVVGALPTLPIFTIIPSSLPWMGRVLILVPVLSSLMVAATFGRRQFNYRPIPTAVAISIAIYSGLFSAFFAFVLSAQASGAFGAGRFLEVGINLWQFSLWAFVWAFVGTTSGLLFSTYLYSKRAKNSSNSPELN